MKKFILATLLIFSGSSMGQTITKSKIGDFTLIRSEDPMTDVVSYFGQVMLPSSKNNSLMLACSNRAEDSFNGVSMWVEIERLRLADVKVQYRLDKRSVSSEFNGFSTGLSVTFDSKLVQSISKNVFDANTLTVKMVDRDLRERTLQYPIKGFAKIIKALKCS